MGLPKVITSDQGREFNNKMNKELMAQLNIDHRLTTAYHPQVLLLSSILILLMYERLASNIRGAFKGVEGGEGGGNIRPSLANLRPP